MVIKICRKLFFIQKHLNSKTSKPNYIYIFYIIYSIVNFFDIRENGVSDNIQLEINLIINL